MADYFKRNPDKSRKHKKTWYHKKKLDPEFRRRHSEAAREYYWKNRRTVNLREQLTRIIDQVFERQTPQGGILPGISETKSPE